MEGAGAGAGAVAAAAAAVTHSSAHQYPPHPKVTPMQQRKPLSTACPRVAAAATTHQYPPHARLLPMPLSPPCPYATTYPYYG